MSRGGGSGGPEPLAGSPDCLRLGLALGGQLVQAHRQPLGAAAVVDEHDRGLVALDQVQQLRVDRRPDRPAGGAVARHRLDVGLDVRLAHVLDRHLDAHVERLAHADVDQRALAAGPREEAAHLLQRALRGGQPDSLHGAAGLPLEALHAQRQVRPALGLRDRVDLVHDQPLHALEQLSRARGEHEVERLRRGDQHVRRLAQHRLPLALRRVAGAEPHRHVAADALQRRAQVALDVVGERLERRDVDEPRAASVVGDGLGHQPVEAPEERGQGLARPRRGREQGVVSRRDRGPGLALRLGRLRERAREPIPYLRGERCERVGRHTTLQRNQPGTSAAGPPSAGAGRTDINRAWPTSNPDPSLPGTAWRPWRAAAGWASCTGRCTSRSTGGWR